MKNCMKTNRYELSMNNLNLQMRKEFLKIGVAVIKTAKWVNLLVKYNEIIGGHKN